MGNKRALVFLLVSLVASLIAVIAGVQWSHRVAEKEKQAALAVTKMVVASADIPSGTRLNPQLIKLVDWPSNSPVVGGFNSLAGLTDRVTTKTMYQGEPVIDKRLAPIGAKAGLAASLEPGHRALTLRVNEIAGVAGFALPGNYVDILVNLQDDQSKPVSKIVLQRVLVLAVAQDQELKDETKAKVVNAVTLDVTPEQTELLDLARSIGNLTLTLRNESDKEEPVTFGARKMELLALAKNRDRPALDKTGRSEHKPVIRHVRAAGPVQAASSSVEIIRGTTHSIITSR